MASFLERIKAREAARAGLGFAKRKAEVVEDELVDTGLTAATAVGFGLAKGYFGREKLMLFQSADPNDTSGKTKQAGSGIYAPLAVGLAGKVLELVGVSAAKSGPGRGAGDLKMLRHAGAVANAALAVGLADVSEGWGQRINAKKNKAQITTTYSVIYDTPTDKLVNQTVSTTIDHDGKSTTSVSGEAGQLSDGYRPYGGLTQEEVEADVSARR